MLKTITIIIKDKTMKLKLLPKYENTIVEIKGIKFDSDVVNEGEYPFFYQNGFAHLFEVEQEQPIQQPKAKKYKGIKEDGKK